MKYIFPFLLVFCLCFSFSSGDAPAYADANSVTVLSDTCIVYETPSFDKPLLKETKSVIFSHGDRLTVISNDTNLSFIQIQAIFQGSQTEGFVYRYYVTFANIEITEYPVFNATVGTDNAVIYTLDKQPTVYTAVKGQGLYLYNGYNDKLEYTAVAVILSDNTVYYGLILTKDIKTKGISAGLITGIVVIISCLTIIFLLLFMKKKKQR